MSQNQQQRSVDVFTLYNNQMSSVRFGYYGRVAFIRISPIFEAYIGRKPEPGAKMYNHDAGIFFPLDLADISRLERGIAMIEAGEIDSFCIPHEGQKSKYLTIGRGNNRDTEMFMELLEVNEEGEVIGDVRFEFQNNDNAVMILNPNADLEGEEVRVEVEWDSFLYFLEAAKLFLTRVFTPEDDYQGRSTRSESRSSAPRRKLSRRGVNRNDDDEGGEEESSAPRRRRRPATAPRGGKDSAPRRVDPEDAGDLFDDE